MGRIKFCEQCGSPLTEGARVCENCGASVPVRQGQRRPPNPGARSQVNRAAEARGQASRNPEVRNQVNWAAENRNPEARSQANRNLEARSQANRTAETRGQANRNPEARSRANQTAVNCNPEARSRANQTAVNCNPEARSQINRAAENWNPEARSQANRAAANRNPEARSQINRAVANRNPEARSQINRAAANRNPQQRNRDLDYQDQRRVQNAGGGIPGNRNQGNRNQANGNQVNRNQVNRNPQGQRRAQAPRPGAAGTEYRPQGAYRNGAGNFYENGDPGRRYRQQEMEQNWQQSWDREPREEDEQRITPAQYVLIGLTVALLAALIIFGVYWIFGRSSDRDLESRSSGQNAAAETSSLEGETNPTVTILDQGGASQTEASGSAQTGTQGTQSETQAVQIQSETAAAQSETQTVQSETAAQSETQTAQTEQIQVIEIQEQTAASSGYLSDSSQRLLTDGDVSGMSYSDMQMAINEIYARHGRKFADSTIQSYFDSQSWYQGTVEPESFSESVFSSTESQNIQFLLNKMGVQ